MAHWKIPISVLVVLHNGKGKVLLLERQDRPDFWQSVTGSLEWGENLFETALREVAEETGLVLSPQQLVDYQKSTVYEIYPHWRHRYGEGITHNTEHWFGAVVDENAPIHLTEHRQYRWLGIDEAVEKVFSPSNAQAILMLKL